MNSKAVVALLTVVACCWAIPLESTTALPPAASSNGTTTLKPGNSSDPIISDSLPSAENITTNSSGLDSQIIGALTDNVTDEKLLDRIIECGLLNDPNYKNNETKAVRSAEILSACGNLTLSNTTTGHNDTSRSTKKPTGTHSTTPAPKKDSKEGTEKKPESTKKPTRRDVTPKVESNSTLPAHNKTDEHKGHANETECDEHGHPLVKGDLKAEGNSTVKNETLPCPKNETLPCAKNETLPCAKNETLTPDHEKPCAKNGTLTLDHDKITAKNETLNSTTTAATTTTKKPASRRRRESYGSQVRVAVRQQPNYAEELVAAPIRSSSYESIRAPIRTRTHKARVIVREESYEPAVRADSYGAPAVREEIYSAPVVREESYEPAVVIRESSSGYEAASSPVRVVESYSQPSIQRTIVRSGGY